MIDITIVGWHLNADAAVCNDCDNPACVVACYDGYSTINLCQSCLDGENYAVVKDEINEVFRGLGL